MASSPVSRTLRIIINPSAVGALTSTIRHLTVSVSVSASYGDERAFIKGPANTEVSPVPTSEYSASIPKSSTMGSIVGKRFYGEATAREADDGDGWNVMLDYRTLRTPLKRNLKCPTFALAKAIAAEWEYQQTDGIRPFTMPLMKLACTALERVPLNRPKIIEHLIEEIPSRSRVLFSSRRRRSNERSSRMSGEELDPLLSWVESEFGYQPVVFTSFFGGKQEEGLVNAIEDLLRKTNDYELAAIDAIAASAHSLVIAIGVFRHRLSIEEAVELIRVEEDLQVDRWGLVEGGHDIDIADLRVQISSAVVFLGLSRMN